jgi:hypothetical protein
LLGGYFVQTAYSVGSPDLVIAGLTVIDPLVAVAIAITVLGEADHFPPFAFGGLAVGGILSVIGVVLLARHHPQTHHYGRGTSWRTNDSPFSSERTRFRRM